MVPVLVTNKKDFLSQLKRTNTNSYHEYTITVKNLIFDDKIVSPEHFTNHISEKISEALLKQDFTTNVPYCISVNTVDQMLNIAIYIPDTEVQKNRVGFNTWGYQTDISLTERVYLTYRWAIKKRSIKNDNITHYDGYGNEISVGDKIVDIKCGSIAVIDKLTSQKVFYYIDDFYASALKNNVLLLKSKAGIVPGWDK